jgi:hypothetical protein
VVVVTQSVAVTSVPAGVNVVEEAPAHVDPATSFIDTALCDTPEDPKASTAATVAISFEQFIFGSAK